MKKSFQKSFVKANSHGGYREGSGRKKKEPTKVIRVRVSKLEAILKLNSQP